MDTDQTDKGGEPEAPVPMDTEIDKAAEPGQPSEPLVVHMGIENDKAAEPEEPPSKFMISNE